MKNNSRHGSVKLNQIFEIPSLNADQKSSKQLYIKSSTVSLT